MGNHIKNGSQISSTTVLYFKLILLLITPDTSHARIDPLIGLIIFHELKASPTSIEGSI